MNPIRLLLALTLIATVTARAATQEIALASTVPPAPPHYPQSTHVYNGCHLSTIAYLARFKAEFPSETGQPLVVMMDNADGSRKAHTIAVITWQHKWWVRDEYFGVCPLGFDFNPEFTAKQINARVVPVLERHFRAQMGNPRIQHPPVVPEELSSAEMQRDVTAAARTIPFPNAVYWVKVGHQEIPFALFRPTAGQIAVYNPGHGTCLADCGSTDDAKVVRAVAALYGYKVESVHADLALPQGALVAAAR
jgi:hypothetical protein